MPAPVRRCSGCCRHTGLHWVGGLYRRSHPSLVFPGNHLRPLNPKTPSHLSFRPPRKVERPGSDPKRLCAHRPPPPHRSAPHFCEPGSPPSSAPVIQACHLAAGEGGTGLVPSTPGSCRAGSHRCCSSWAFADLALLSPDVDGQTAQLIRFHFFTLPAISYKP